MATKKKPKINIVLEFEKPSKVFNKAVYDHLQDYTNFTEVYWGGASSGKSHGVVQKVIFKASLPWKYPRKIMFTRKVGSSIKESIFADVLACLSDWDLLSRCKVNNTDFRITLPNGAEFIFKGLDDREKIKSIKGVSDVVMEEATEFDLDDYTQLTLRLRERKHKNKQIFLMFNPVSKLNWVFKYFFGEEAEYNPERTAIHHSTYKDNRFLDEDTRRTIQDLERRNPAYYRIYALGEFATLDKLVFPTTMWAKRRIDPSSKELTGLEDLFGLDFGYVNDPSAFIRVKADIKNKKLYFVEEYTKKGLLNDAVANKIHELGWQKEIITADSAEKKSIDEIKKLDVPRIRPAVKGPDSIRHGIQFLLQFDFIVDDRCVKLIEELENYTYVKDKKTGEYTNKPVDSYNHLIDASRYAVEHLNRKGKWLV